MLEFARIRDFHLSDAEFLKLESIIKGSKPKSSTDFKKPIRSRVQLPAHGINSVIELANTSFDSQYWLDAERMYAALLSQGVDWNPILKARWALSSTVLPFDPMAMLMVFESASSSFTDCPTEYSPYLALAIVKSAIGRWAHAHQWLQIAALTPNCPKALIENVKTKIEWMQSLYRKNTEKAAGYLINPEHLETIKSKATTVNWDDLEPILQKLQQDVSSCHQSADESGEFSELVNFIVGEEESLNLQHFDDSTADAQSDSPFSQIDEQCFTKLARWLDVQSIGRLATTCKMLSNWSRQDDIWMDLAVGEFGLEESAILASSQTDVRGMVHHLVDVTYVFQKLPEAGINLESQEATWGDIFRKIYDPRTHSLFVPPLISYKNQVVSMALEGLLGAMEWCPSTGGFVEKLSQKTGLLFSLLELLVRPDFYIAMPLVQTILTLLLEMVTLPTTFGRSICDQLNGGNFTLVLNFLRSNNIEIASGLIAALAAVPHTNNLEHQLSKKPASVEEEEDASKAQPLKGLFHLSLVDYNIDSFVNVSNTATTATTSSNSLCEFADLGLLRLELDEKSKQLVAIGIDSTNPSKEYTMEVSLIKEVSEDEEQDAADAAEDEEDEHVSTKAGKGADSAADKKSKAGKKNASKHEEPEEEEQEEEAEEAPTVLVFRIPRPNGKILLCRGTMLPGRMIGTFKETTANAPTEEEGGFYGCFFAWLDARPYSPELWKAEKQSLEAYKRTVVEKRKPLKLVGDSAMTNQHFGLVLNFLVMQWFTSHWTRASASEIEEIMAQLSEMTELGNGDEIEPHMKDLEVALYRGPQESDALFKKRALLAAHLRMIIAQIQNQLMEAMENELKEDTAVISKNISSVMQSPAALNAVSNIVRKYRRIVATSPIVDPANIITPDALLSMYAEMSDPKAKKEREEARAQMEEEEKEAQRLQQQQQNQKVRPSKNSAKIQQLDDEDESDDEDDDEDASSFSTATKLLIFASAVTAAAAIGAYALGRWFSKKSSNAAAPARK